jgi:hypothetical protein
MKRMQILGVIACFYNCFSCSDCQIGSLQSHKVEKIPNCVDMVIFSYNRPLQLYELLESIEEMVKSRGAGYVLYRADNQEYECAYKQVEQQFPSYIFVRQYKKEEFKPLLIHIVNHLPHDYLLFAVDDDIAKDSIDLSQVARYMEITNTYGYYLRLGFNTTECYMLKRHQGIPKNIHEIAPGVYAWQFCDGFDDWNYPQNLDMTIYRKTDVLPAITRLPYSSPNTLEGCWSSITPRMACGLCSQESCIVNTPLNLVQFDCRSNRNSNSYTAQELLEKWQEGLKIDWHPLVKMRNVSAHIDFNPTFIRR